MIPKMHLLRVSTIIIQFAQCATILIRQFTWPWKVQWHTLPYPKLKYQCMVVGNIIIISCDFNKASCKIYMNNSRVSFWSVLMLNVSHCIPFIFEYQLSHNRIFLTETWRALFPLYLFIQNLFLISIKKVINIHD